MTTYDCSFIALINQHPKNKKPIESCGLLVLPNPLLSTWSVVSYDPCFVNNTYQAQASLHQKVDFLSQSGTETKKLLSGAESGSNHEQITTLSEIPLSRSSHNMFFVAMHDREQRICIESYRPGTTLENMRESLSWYLCKGVRKGRTPPTDALSMARKIEAVYDHFYWRVERAYNPCVKPCTIRNEIDKIITEITELDDTGLEIVMSTSQQENQGPFDHAPIILLLRLVSERIVPKDVMNASQCILSLLTDENDQILVRELEREERWQMEDRKPAVEGDKPSVRAVTSLLSWLSHVATRDVSLDITAVTLSSALKEWLQEFPPREIQQHEKHGDTTSNSAQSWIKRIFSVVSKFIKVE